MARAVRHRQQQPRRRGGARRCSREHSSEQIKILYCPTEISGRESQPAAAAFLCDWEFKNLNFHSTLFFFPHFYFPASGQGTHFFFFFLTLSVTFQLLDKPWSQVSSLLPPGSCLHFLSRKGCSNPTARRYFLECCQLTLSRSPQVNLCTRKRPNEFIRVCTRRGSNSRN